MTATWEWAPIHWVPPTTGTPSRVVANDETMKFWFSAQSYEAVPDRPFSASRILCTYHSPSFLTRTAENRAAVGKPPPAGVTSVMPSSRTTSGVSCLMEVTWMASFAPLLSANTFSYIFSMAARPLCSWPS